MWERAKPSRREFLARAGNGFGLVALADLLARRSSPAAAPAPDPAAHPFPVRAPHHTPPPQTFTVRPGARRAVSHRPVRPRAEGGRDERPAAPLREAQARARQDRQPAGLPLEVPEAWRVRDRDQRAPAMPRDARRRPLR